MKYFITGATGFLGGCVARQLVDGGHTVNALVRSPAKAAALQALGIQLFRGDVTDTASLRAPMAGVDGVYHIAGWYKIGARDKTEAQRVNVDGTRNVLEAMRDLGIPKGVYTSTVAIFSDTHGRKPDETYRYEGPHISEYDRTKAIAHRVAEGFIRAADQIEHVVLDVEVAPTRRRVSNGSALFGYKLHTRPGLSSRVSLHLLAGGR